VRAREAVTPSCSHAQGTPRNTALWWFKLVFPVCLFLRILEATNVEGERRYSGSTRGGRPRRPWVPLTLAVVYEFIALVIMMGVHHLPDVRMYWTKTHPALGVRGPFRKIMSARRFKSIRASMRFCVPTEQPKVCVRLRLCASACVFLVWVLRRKDVLLLYTCVMWRRVRAHGRCLPTT
jgi:hypothetical protein